MTQRVDKDSLPLNQPRRTPGHPTKSHIVKTKVDGKEKVIRFGEQGASTAGKPKAGESDRMKAKRESFKARHAKNIAKGPSSPAYWANKVKWADGGSVRTHYAEGDSVRVQPQNATLGAIANLLKQSYSPQRTQQMQGTMELLGVPAVARTVERLSYGQPITNVNKANVPLLLDDTAETAMVVGPMAGPLARVAKTAGKAGARVVGEELNRAILDNSGPLSKLVPEAAKPMYVVKPKGGNWLSGSVESVIQPLKPTVLNETGLKNLAERAGVDVAEEVRIRQQPSVAVNRWLDTKLDKYLRNDIGTPGDPVRALAERGILHVDPERGLDYVAQDVVRNRMSADSMVRTPTLDSPGTRMGVMPAAREWEDTTDSLIVPRSAGDLTAGANKSPYWETSLTAEHRLEQDPWLAKLPPETPVYHFGGDGNVSERLGLPHLVDELKFSMDPSSGLPQQLRFDPKDVDKITVPQAVERVSKINAWRAEQAAQAEKAGMMENLTATPRMADEGLQLSFVGKPGGAWVDIPETIDPKGMKLCNSIGKAGGWCTQNDWAAKSYGSGDNRLTALVDAEGRPHAQAKISTSKVDASATEMADYLTEEEAVGDQFYRNIATVLEQRGVPDAQEIAETIAMGSPRDLPKEIRDMLPEIEAEAERMLPVKKLPKPDVTELKPPGNSFNSDRAQEYMKRDPEYKAKVTDSVLKFLNSGEWGKVDDLHHYDIVDLQNPTTVQTALKDVLPYHLSMERAGVFNQAIDANPNAPRFMTQQQLRDFIGPVELPNTDVPGFQAGGLVKGAVKNIGEMVQKYLARETAEAAAKAAPAPAKEQKMLQGFYRGYAGENPDTAELFVTPQKRVADYYAQKRAGQTGDEAHAEMILADPFAGRTYGHATAGSGAEEPMFTRAKKIKPEEVKDRTQLYAKGGSVSAYDPFQVEDIMNSINAPRNYAEGGSVKAYDSSRVDAILNQFM
jgi:hypothetical protein